MLGGTHIITHKEEYQIMFLPDRLMDNLIRAAFQTPPRVLKDNNLILPMGLMCIRLRDLLLTLLKDNNLILLMGLMCIRLRDLLLTLLKGAMFILFLGKQITQLIMLRTHRVMQMFLSHHRIMFILVRNNRM
jgi:hypothetical protein